MIVIVDYGMGNLKSVQNAATLLGHKTCISKCASVIGKATKIIFPGVGHFAQAIRELKKRRLITVLKEKIRAGIPFLGICLGMQILFEESEEARGVKGFGIIRGKVRRFKSQKLIVPHMGWNELIVSEQKHALMAGVETGDHAYFVHSYHFKPASPAAEVATVNYGGALCAAVAAANIFGTQFHPEKSQATGLRILSNFLGWKP